MFKFIRRRVANWLLSESDAYMGVMGGPVLNRPKVKEFETHSLTQVTAGQRLVTTMFNQYYNLFKGVSGGEDTVIIANNASYTWLFKPNSAAPSGTPILAVQDNTGVDQFRLTSDGSLWFRDGALTDGVDIGQLNTWTAWSGVQVNQNGSIAATINSARYTVVGKLALVQVRLTVGGDVNGGGANLVVGGLPNALLAKDKSQDTVVGTFKVTKTGLAHYAGAVIMESNDTLTFQTNAVGSRLGNTPSIKFTLNDNIAFDLMYETA